MNLFERPHGVHTRWFSFENQSVMKGRAAHENQGAKGHAFDHIKAGETKTLLDVDGSGTICRIWLTIDDRSPEMLRSLRLEMFWDGADKPAVCVPLGDFFGVGLGRKVAFECALFSDPEGRSFNCFIPMPFRVAAKITITNESARDLVHLFYDIDFLMGVSHTPETLYFHALWRRDSPNPLGYDFEILPQVAGLGRFLGCNIGVIANPAYEGAWWGEGEVKVRFDGEAHATLCGSGTEDYIGTGWGQGLFAHRTQGCLVADKDAGHWCFYRYHIDDPVYFDVGCRVSIQTIGGSDTQKVLTLKEGGVPLIPVSVDTGEAGGFIQLFDGQPHDLQSPDFADKWCNFWRQDDWSATAYFYLDSPQGCFSGIQSVAARLVGEVVT